ncbi:MAG: hypothetical protein KDK04_21950 [Candidatus Competibacteraceae bacterium]|nr:hypothetical protein [Candidatus Competibacteraceae bacterium]
MTRHFLIGGCWVGRINDATDEQIAQRRQELAKQFAVDVERVQVARPEQLCYTK